MPETLPPDLTEEQFLKSLQIDQPQQNPPSPIFPSGGLAPLTTGAVEVVKRNIFGSTIGQAENQAAATERLYGKRQDVPLDTQDGIPLSVQFAAEVNRRQKDVVGEYKRVYGNENVDVNPEGGIVIRNIEDPNTGEVSDILAHPKNLGMHNIVSLSVSAPEIVAGALAARTGNAAGAWNAVKAIAAMAGVSQAVGAAKDVVVRSIQGTPIEIDEIAKERAKLAGLDFLAGSVIGGAVKGATLAITPFNNRGLMQRQADEAIEFLLPHTGTRLQQTPGERTGSALLLRMEAMAKKFPGSSTVFSSIVQTRDKAIELLQRKFLGLPTKATEEEIEILSRQLPSAEDVGEKALATIGAKTARIDEAVENAGVNVQRVGTRELSTVMGANPDVPTSLTDIGKLARGKALSNFSEFKVKTDADYEALFTHELAQQKNLPADSLAKSMQTILDKLPSKTRRIESVDYDTYGSPVLRTREGKEILKDFVPQGVLGRLQELASLKGQKFSLDELKQMRTDVDNAIAEGLAIPNTKVHYLGEMRSALSNAIKTGVDDLGDPTLKTLWETANTGYATGIKRFEPMSVRKLLIPEGEKGALGNAEIAASVTGGSPGSIDAFNDFKGFFGVVSSEFSALKQSIKEDVLGGAFNSSTGFVDAKSFLRKLGNTPPEVAKEVFGASQKDLARIAESVGVAEGSIDLNALRNLASSRGLTYDAMKDFMSEQAKKTQIYRNKILKDVSKGNLSTEKIEPSEFVARFARNSEPKDIRDVIARLSDHPELLQDIRRVAIEDFLSMTSLGTRGGSATAEKLSAGKIYDQFHVRKQADAYRAVFGDDTFNQIVAIAKVLRPGESYDAIASGAGSLGGSAVLASIFQKGELSAIGRSINNAVLALLYTVPPIKRMISNTLITKENAARIVNTAIASEPFAKEVLRQYGEVQGQNIMEYLGGEVAPLFKSQSAPSKAPAKDIKAQTEDEFLKSLGP